MTTELLRLGTGPDGKPIQVNASALQAAAAQNAVGQGMLCI